jgi:hypothetical protein
MESIEITMQDVLKLCEKRPDIGLLIENEALKRKVEELTMKVDVAHGLTSAINKVPDDGN